MKKLLTALSLTACTFAAMAQASAPAAAPREKGPCVQEADAKGLKDAARKSFIAECRSTMKAKHQAEHKAKREACTAEVKGKQLKGAEAREAMKSCMGK